MSTSPRIMRRQDITGAILQLIGELKLETGDRVPSLRDLSKRYHVSHETIRHALHHLEQEGVVTKVHGRGTVVGDSRDILPLPASMEDPVLPKISVGTDALTLATCEYGSEKASTWRGLVKEYAERFGVVKPQLSPLRKDLQQAPLDALPAVIHVPSWQADSLWERGMLLDLSPWIGPDPYEGDSFGGCREAEARRYAVPVAFDIPLLYVNSDQLSAADMRALDANWSLAALVEWAASVGTVGRPLILPRPHLLLGALGINARDIAELDRNIAALPAALAQLATLQHRYPIYGASNWADDPNAEALRGFNGGNTLIISHHSFALRQALDVSRFRWEVRPFPLNDGARAQRVDLCVAVTKNCTDPEAAAEFVHYLTSPAAQRRMADGRTNIPMRRSAALEGFRDGEPFGLRDVVSTLGPTSELSRLGSQAFGIAYAGVWDQEVTAFLTDGGDIEDVCARVQRRCRSLIIAHGLENVTDSGA